MSCIGSTQNLNLLIIPIKPSPFWIPTLQKLSTFYYWLASKLTKSDLLMFSNYFSQDRTGIWHGMGTQYTPIPSMWYPEDRLSNGKICIYVYTRIHLYIQFYIFVWIKSINKKNTARNSAWQLPKLLQLLASNRKSFKTLKTYLTHP
jgi:hypothetical protein